MASLLERLQETGARIAPCRRAATLQEAEAAARDLGVPLWARSVEDTGGFCMQVEHAGDLPLAIAKVRKRAGAADAPLLLQQAVDAPVVRVIGFQMGRTYAPVEIIEESYSEGLYRVPMMLAAPAGLDADAYAAIIAAAYRAAAALPSASGVLEMSFALDAQTPALLDVRCSDKPDPFHTRLLRIALGVDLDAEAARVAGGMPPIAAPTRGMAAVIKWLEAPSGALATIEGLAAARALPGIEAVTVNLQPGDVIRHMADTAARDRIGWVIATGPVRGIALARAQAAIAAIQFRTQPVI